MQELRFSPMCVVAFVLTACVIAHAQEYTTLRYAPYEGQVPEHVSDPDPVESVIPTVGTMVRSEQFAVFEDFHFGEFRGDQRFVPEALAGLPIPAGEFTLTAYLRIPSQTETSETLGGTVFSSESPDGTDGGVCLNINADLQVEASIRIADGLGEGIETRKLQSPEPLQLGQWYRIVYRYQRHQSNAVHRHDIWINQRPVAFEELGAQAVRVEEVSMPVIGARRTSSGYGDGLIADVHAVQLDDHAQSDNYLGSAQLRDGSGYFGGVDYHDYLGTPDTPGTKAGGRTLERRMHSTWEDSVSGAVHYPAFAARLQERWMLPFQNDGYVVQGLAYDPVRQRIFIAMYHLAVDGVSYAWPSIVVEVFANEGRVGNVFVLHDENGVPMASHVGGIAYWEGYLFVPDRGTGSALNPDLFVYSISNTPDAQFDPAPMTGFQPVVLPALARYVDPLGNLVGEDGRFNSLSFMGIHLDARQEVMLHIGNFQSSRPADTHLFRLDLSMQVPALIYEITLTQSHRRSQGMAFYFDAVVGGRDVHKSLLATSFGDNDSVLYSLVYVDGGTPALSPEFVRLPAGLEEIAVAGNSLWGTSESGALYYQKRASNPWTDNFPFLFKIDIESLIDANGNGIPDSWYARHKLSQAVHPDSDPDGDGFSIREEYFADTDPLNRSDFPYTKLDAAARSLTIPGSKERFYAYQQSHDLNEWRPVPGMEQMRGTNGPMVFPITLDGERVFFRIITRTQ